MGVFRDSFEQCPRCGVDLMDARSASSCPQCKGLWLREDILTEMVITMLPVPTVGRLVFAPTAQDKRVACPSCHQPMVLTTLADVVVDRCAAHGVWFDREELEQVLRRSATPSAIGALFAELDTSRVPSSRGLPAPDVPVLRFRITRASTIRLVELQREIVKLGRSGAAHIVLNEHSGADELHAVIEATSTDTVTLLDLGSKPATRVNGEPITRALLHSGDLIGIGDTTIAVEIAAH
jgi:Zn-finger nucleic acid-binding protein